MDSFNGINITLASLIVLMNIAVVFGNVGVIIAMLFNRKLRTTRYYMITSMAVADVCLGIFVIPFAGTNLILKKWPLGLEFCRIYQTSDILFSTVSILHLCAIAWDQFIAVRFPFHYKTVLNNTTIWSVIAFIWVVAGLIAIVPVNFKTQWYREPTMLENYLNPQYCFIQIRKEFSFVVLPLTFYLPMISMVAIYLYIIVTVRKRFRKIYGVAPKGEGITSNLCSITFFPSTFSRHNNITINQRKRKTDLGTNISYTEQQYHNTKPKNKVQKRQPNKEQNKTELESVESQGEVMNENERENIMKYRKVLLMLGLNFLLKKMHVIKPSNVNSSGRCEGEEISGGNGLETSIKHIDGGKTHIKVNKIGPELAVKFIGGNSKVEVMSNPSLIPTIHTKGNKFNRKIKFQTQSIISVNSTQVSYEGQAMTTINIINDNNQAANNKLNILRPNNIAKNAVNTFDTSHHNNAQNLNSFLAEARLKKQVRALKTVGMITLTFVICWTPFCFLFVWQSACWCLSDHALNSIMWLGYMNSCFNPYIYAVWNNDFRKAYSTILKSVYKCCKRAH
ncbi:unnamed protein product [Gordionus sp. m RMFG-2023]